MIDSHSISNSTPLLNLIEAYVCSLVKGMMVNPDTDKAIPPVFGVKTLSEMTGYSINTIYSKTSKNEIPHYKRDGRLFFKKDEVEKWLTMNKILTKEEYSEELNQKLLNRYEKKAP